MSGQPRHVSGARSPPAARRVGGAPSGGPALHAATSRALGTDEVDLVDLARASALLRFEAVRNGVCLYEATAGEHEAFVLEATLFWCDAGWVIRRAQSGVLAELSP